MLAGTSDTYKIMFHLIRDIFKFTEPNDESGANVDASVSPKLLLTVESFYCERHWDGTA